MIDKEKIELVYLGLWRKVKKEISYRVIVVFVRWGGGYEGYGVCRGY